MIRRCEDCDAAFDTDTIPYEEIGVPGGDLMCFDCLIECCTNCGDRPPGGVDGTMQMCEMCMEHIFGEDYDPED